MRKNRAPPAPATATMMISVSGGGRGGGGREGEGRGGEGRGGEGRARNVNYITPGARKNYPSKLVEYKVLYGKCSAFVLFTKSAGIARRLHVRPRPLFSAIARDVAH